MKAGRTRLFLAAGFVLCLAAAVYAHVAGKQGREGKTSTTHHVIFELTSDNPESWEALLNNIQNLQQALGSPKTQIELMAHAKGLGIMLKKNTALAKRMQQIAGSGVVFAACENTMRRQKIGKGDLLPFVQTVESGVAEVVRKQEAGWSYLKSGS